MPNQSSPSAPTPIVDRMRDVLPSDPIEAANEIDAILVLAEADHERIRNSAGTNPDGYTIRAVRPTLTK